MSVWNPYRATMSLTTMSGDLTESDRLTGLLQFFARDCHEWPANLPARSEQVHYAARGTPLTSTWPLFAVTYELWYLLNSVGIVREDSRSKSLAQLRILLQIIWDVGRTDCIDWNVGDADRWDDYWQLV